MRVCQCHSLEKRHGTSADKYIYRGPEFPPPTKAWFTWQLTEISSFGGENLSLLL
jgi:hypothetical protein